MNMKLLNKKDLLKVIDQSTEDLHQKIDLHRYLMANILDKGVGDETLKRVFWPSPCSPHERRLKEAIREAIEVLEQSRKAFKSKRLEALRKKLTDVLTEFN
jgi:hypothetical protein